MPVSPSGIPLLAEVAARAVHEHGNDWPSIQRAIQEALAELPAGDREALDAEIRANQSLISLNVDKLGH